MKIRNDFVTNSSSSSFIVSVKGTNKLPEDLQWYIKHGTKISEVDEPISLTDFIESTFKRCFPYYENVDGYYDENSLQLMKDVGMTEIQIKAATLATENAFNHKLYKQLQSADEKGRTVHIFSVDNNFTSEITHKIKSTGEDLIRIIEIENE